MTNKLGRFCTGCGNLIDESSITTWVDDYGTVNERLYCSMQCAQPLPIATEEVCTECLGPLIEIWTRGKYKFCSPECSHKWKSPLDNNDVGAEWHSMQNNDWDTLRSWLFDEMVIQQRIGNEKYKSDIYGFQGDPFQHLKEELEAALIYWHWESRRRSMSELVTPLISMIEAAHEDLNLHWERKLDGAPTDDSESPLRILVNTLYKAANG